jgi:hypothetical protein
MRSRVALLVLLSVGACKDESFPPYNGYIPDDGGLHYDLSAAVCVPKMATSECASNTDCDDGDPATVDTCVLVTSGEFPAGTCLHSGCDGGLACVTQAVDPTCLNPDAGTFYPPFVPLYAPDVPTSCANGFQLGNASSTFTYVIGSKTTAGSRALALDLDFATYEAPDGMQITGVDGSCKEYTLFDSCDLQTSDKGQAAYTDGTHRPSDVAIRQYHLALRPGTSQLTFNFSRVNSPMYVQVLGLCDFDLPTPTSTAVGWFGLVN